MRNLTAICVMTAIFGLPAAAQESGESTGAQQNIGGPLKPLISSEEASMGFVPIFNGRDLTGWRNFKGRGVKDGWSVQDGVLVVEAGGGDIITNAEYDSFDFRFEFKVAEGGNSGVFYSVQEDDSVSYPWQTGPEYQILDNERHVDGRSDMTSSGALYALQPTSREAAEPVGEWNTGRVVRLGNRVQHYLNGVKVADYEWGSDELAELIANSKFSSMPGFAKVRTGHLGLQDHGDRVEFRHLRVRRLDAGSVSDTASRTPNTLTPDERADGWRLLFDGRSLGDWRGYKQQSVPEGWFADDGVLVTEGGPDLITKDQYDDFELVIDWKVGPRGNSGIFYGAQEVDGPIYTSAPEMQILDNQGHGVDGTDVHAAGGNYALHGPAEDAAKPAGEWNRARIVKIGDRVEHYLNGVKVVDYVWGSDDWKQRVADSKFAAWPVYARSQKGHLGLQFHGDRIEFRNIRVRPL